MSENKIQRLFDSELVVINLGLESFADQLREQDVKVLQMDWRPPCGGDRRLIDLLENVERRGSHE